MLSRFKTNSLVSFSFLIAGLVITHPVASAPTIPNPILYFTGSDAMEQGGKTLIRYHYDVFNKDEFPAEMFAAAPNLPPCGANTKASRTWVDLYDQKGKRLYSFCALTKPADLNQIYFALEQGVTPPSWVYVEMTDRKTNAKYKSNLAESTD